MTLALCIPAYNAEKYLPRLLLSAKNQIPPFDEILVYNDCSTDNTKAIAEKFGATVINGDENRGCSYGKNKLAAVAKSTWLHFHDADDDLLPNFMDVVKRRISGENVADIILLNFKYVDAKTNELIATLDYDREQLLLDNKKFVIEHKMVNFAMIKTDKFLKVGGFNLAENVLYNEDRAFYSRAAVEGLTFDYEPDITCINFRHQQSMSASNKEKCTFAYFHVTEYLRENLGFRYPAEIANAYWENATGFALSQNWNQVKACVKNARSLGSKYPTNQSSNFIMFSKIAGPFIAYWLREKSIRMLKRHLRKQ